MRNNNNGLRTYMNKEDALEMLEEKYGDCYNKDKNMCDNIRKDYEDLFDLRNRLTEPDTNCYEEDHTTLDNVLDYMEILMKLIGMGD